jgi:hypothetical protein
MRRIKRVAGMNYPCNLIAGIRYLSPFFCHPTSVFCHLIKVVGKRAEGIETIAGGYSSEMKLSR